MIHLIYKMKNRSSFIAAVTLFFLSLCGIQAEAKTQFSCMLWESQPYPEVFYLDGQKMLPLELISDRRSELYELKNAVETFELYISQSLPSGESEMKLVGTATIPPKVKRMLFIIKHTPTNQELPLSMLAVNDSLDVFPAGTFRLINFTNEKLSVSVGDDAQEMRPRQIRLLQPEIPEKGGLVSLVISNSEGEPVFGRRLFGQSRARQMVFVVAEEGAKGGVRAKLVPDIVTEKSR